MAESGCVWLQRSLSRCSYPGGREGGCFWQLLASWPGRWLNEECLRGRVGGRRRGPRGLRWRASVNGSPLGLSSGGSPLWAVIIAKQLVHASPFKGVGVKMPLLVGELSLLKSSPLPGGFPGGSWQVLGLGGTTPRCPPGDRASSSVPAAERQQDQALPHLGWKGGQGAEPVSASFLGVLLPAPTFLPTRALAAVSTRGACYVPSCAQLPAASCTSASPPGCWQTCVCRCLGSPPPPCQQQPRGSLGEWRAKPHSGTRRAALP